MLLSHPKQIFDLDCCFFSLAFYQPRRPEKGYSFEQQKKERDLVENFRNLVNLMAAASVLED